MTNILAAIFITVSTNWTPTGTFTPIEGPAVDVQEGRLATNTTAIVEWRGQRHELLLETVLGPKVGERRLPKPAPPVRWATNWTIPVVLTNYGTAWITNTL